MRKSLKDEVLNQNTMNLSLPSDLKQNTHMRVIQFQ